MLRDVFLFLLEKSAIPSIIATAILLGEMFNAPEINSTSEVLGATCFGVITSKCKNIKRVGPGLAQLVERLTHGYSESMSSKPSNLTSATVCGDRTGDDAGHQEVGMCSTRGGSWGMYITFASKKK